MYEMKFFHVFMEIEMFEEGGGRAFKSRSQKERCSSNEKISSYDEDFVMIRDDRYL